MNRNLCELAFLNGRSIVTSELFLKTGRYHASPAQVYAQINNSCNSRCLMCDCWRQTARELSADQWIEGLLRLKSIIGKFKLCFTGGEVFVKEDFFHILSFCKREGILFGITTNGIALNENTAKRLLGLNPVNIHFSLDSLDEDTYCRIRGVPLLETVKSNIQKTAEYARKSPCDVVLTIKTVVNSLNLHELCQIAEYSEKMGLSGITFDMIKKRRSFFLEHTLPEFEELFNMEPSCMEDAVGRLIEKKKNGSRILNSEESMKQWGKEKEKNGTELCRVPLRNLYIGSQGEIKCCENINIVIANITDPDLKTKLESKRADEIRRGLASCKEPCDYCVKRNLGDYTRLFFRFSHQ